MPWSSMYGNERGNLTSLLGALAGMKEGKKNRKSQFFNTLLGIGGQLGGTLLQNKLGKQAEGRGYAQELALRQADREAAERERYSTDWRRSQESALERGYSQQEAEQAHKYRMAEIGAGRRGEGEPGTEYGAVYNFIDTFFKSSWGPNNGVIGRDGSVNFSRMTPEMVKKFRADALAEARAVPGLTSADVNAQIDRYFPSAPTETGGAQPAGKGREARQAARAEEAAKAEQLRPQVLQALAEVKNAYTAAKRQPPQIVLQINSGLLSPQAANSVRLADMLQKLQEAMEALQIPQPGNQMETQMQSILKSGVPGLPKVGGTTGSAPQLDLSKIRF